MVRAACSYRSDTISPGFSAQTLAPAEDPNTRLGSVWEKSCREERKQAFVFLWPLPPLIPPSLSFWPKRSCCSEQVPREEAVILLFQHLSIISWAALSMTLMVKSPKGHWDVFCLWMCFCLPFKGIVHPKFKISPICNWPPCRWRSWWDFLICVTVLELHGWNWKFHTVDTYSHVLQHKNKCLEKNGSPTWIETTT